MKKIIFIILLFVSASAIGQQKTKYAERLNPNGTIDSFYVKQFTDSVFNYSNDAFISFTVEHYTKVFGSQAPAGMGNFHFGADGVYRNYSQTSQDVLNGSITNADLEGNIDLTTKVTGVLPFLNGGSSGGSVATSATTGAMTVNMTSRIITITPTGNCTFNASGGVVGQMITFIITTSGTTSFTMTWGTNFRKAGTLATGTTSARFFAVSFICINGTIWQEISRTAVQT